MEIIPVLDLQRGQAVHARGGARRAYRPVQSSLLPGRVGDAVALARAYRTVIGAEQCYVADLDAIEGWTPQLDLIRRLAHPEQGFGSGLLIDGGITAASAAEPFLAAGATTVVVGLETLKGFKDLAAVVQRVGSARVIFSLDMMHGKPVRRRTGRIAREEGLALELGARAAEVGVETILVLDLAAVGKAVGPHNLDTIMALKHLVGVRVYAGGGVRSRDDLRVLEEAGCDGALVGTALHEAQLAPDGTWELPGGE
jgi:phosphoribosylformimino-5-aminoimidazole carboxamide ribotide isomerase